METTLKDVQDITDDHIRTLFKNLYLVDLEKLKVPRQLTSFKKVLLEYTNASDTEKERIKTFLNKTIQAGGSVKKETKNQEFPSRSTRRGFRSQINDVLFSSKTQYRTTRKARSKRTK
jgi:hypothetical protein